MSLEKRQDGEREREIMTDINYIDYGTPVSYTHLDVYKRQPILRAGSTLFKR